MPTQITNHMLLIISILMGIVNIYKTKGLLIFHADLETKQLVTCKYCFQIQQVEQLPNATKKLPK